MIPLQPHPSPFGHRFLPGAGPAEEAPADADLVIPVPDSGVPAALGFPKPIVGLSTPAVKPVFKTKYVGDVVMALAKAVGGSVAGAFGWESYEACLKQTLGGAWGSLVKNGYVVDGQFKPAEFETASQTFEFTNPALATLPAKLADERRAP